MSRSAQPPFSPVLAVSVRPSDRRAHPVCTERRILVQPELLTVLVILAIVALLVIIVRR